MVLAWLVQITKFLVVVDKVVQAARTQLVMQQKLSRLTEAVLIQFTQRKMVCAGL